MAQRIDAKDLNIYYGDFLAVAGVNMSIEPRSVTALIGPSGCGKSTFLRSVNRMHEVIPGARVEGSASAWFGMAYIAVFPSFIAYLFFNRGIELIGAARAGQSWHLMPVFGSILAVLFLGETFYAYHAIGIAMIAGGILLASVRAAPAIAGPQADLKHHPRANA